MVAGLCELKIVAVEDGSGVAVATIPGVIANVGNLVEVAETCVFVAVLVAMDFSMVSSNVGNTIDTGSVGGGNGFNQDVGLM